MSEDKLAHAMSQAAAQFESIREMVDDLQREDDDDDDSRDRREAAEQSIHEDPLSVQVRSGWYTPGARDPHANEAAPEEFEILLCTGGPAVRIIGKLSEHGEPESAWLECQDWFTPWARWRGPVSPSDPNAIEDIEETLLTYCRCFYFGE